ncbi:hypothetical protein HPB51_006223 [Rhipicephalus microplus]|uniref:Protein masquerade clip-domain domain-containing protein n=1 Tax=Rhipicephalus microplus TaxID=6941 RepID=A0A9J6DL43_RHIMP|nr:hypothetical protein HPB51_006223 [Rhipicephalus microplus]
MTSSTCQRLEELQSLRLCHHASDTRLPAALDIRALVRDIVRAELHGHCSSCAPPSTLTSAPTNLRDIIRQEVASASHLPCSAESRPPQVPTYTEVAALSAHTTIPAATPGGHVPVACQRDDQRGYATEERGRFSPLMNYQRTPYRSSFQRSPSPPYSMGLPVNSQTTTEKLLYPCPGNCVPTFLTWFCDATNSDYECSSGRVCCMPTTTTTPAEDVVPECPGTCIPPAISGLCKRPARLVLKTTTCGRDLICCTETPRLL